MTPSSVDDSGQQGFFDQPINDQEVLRGLRDACAISLDNKEAASYYAGAQRKIKELLPSVSEPTRFMLGEDLAIEVRPGSREEYTVAQTDSIQRKKIVTDFQGEA